MFDPALRTGNRTVKPANETPTPAAATPAPAALGTPGQPWGDAERQAWRARQRRQRSYADDVLAPLSRLPAGLERLTYGELDDDQRYPLQAVRTGPWRPDRPSVLVTGGVHGYETSGVGGALRFLIEHAPALAAEVNLLVAPCVSPWGYEHIQRWNPHAVDPNRAFGRPGTAMEADALTRLVAGWPAPFTAHIDLHETTDTDETEFRPALAARDGQVFQPGHIPDGFYLVDDADNPQPDFQAAIIAAVARVTHIAPADERGQIIGCPVVAPGVVHYPLKAWGLCASVSGARYTTTTEVYPDSPRTNPEQCIAAQVAAARAAVGFVLAGAQASGSL